jgi:predicted transcriptional regulator
MAETEHTQQNIAYIRTHVDHVEQLTRFAIASNPGCAQFIEDYLQQRQGAAEVYLRVGEKPMGLEEIMKATRQSKANVSKICSHLANHGIIAKVPDPDNARSFKYCWTDLEDMLGVSKIAKQVSRGS